MSDIFKCYFTKKKRKKGKKEIIANAADDDNIYPRDLHLLLYLHRLKMEKKPQMRQIRS